MKILLVCGAGIISGKEVMTLELACGLRSSGWDIHVLTSTWNNGAFPKKLEDTGLSFVSLPLGFLSLTLTPKCLYMTAAQLIRWPKLLFRYRALLRHMQPDKVIHTNWHHLLLLLPYLRPGRDLFWLHEVVPDRRHYRAIFQMLNRHLHGFISVSNAVARSLRRIGIPDHKIQMIHNGLTDPAQGIERMPSSDWAVRLGIVGQVGKWKGHDDLLEAFGCVSPQWPNAELHIFGQGAEDYEHHLRQRAVELGIVDKVTWHGFVSDRAAIFNHLDICVIPSRSDDPLPTVALEAAGFGLPVVATWRGGLPEIIEQGLTGVLVPAENPTELAAAIDSLVADRESRLAMGANARQRLLKHFTSEHFVRRFVEVLQSSWKAEPGGQDRGVASRYS